MFFVHGNNTTRPEDMLLNPFGGKLRLAGQRAYKGRNVVEPGFNRRSLSQIGRAHV